MRALAVAVVSLLAPAAVAGFEDGSVRIENIGPPINMLGDHATGVTDVSLDGRYVLLARRIRSRDFRLRIFLGDLTTGVTRQIAESTAAVWYSEHVPAFDREGRRVLYRRRHELWSYDLVAQTGIRLVRDAGAGPFRWVDDGGIAYVSKRGSLVVLHPRRPRETLTLPGYRWGSPGPHRVSIAPDGTRVLFSAGCNVWLADMRTGRRRVFARATYNVTPRSWSPSGEHVALAQGGWNGCDRDFDGYHSDTVVFTIAGRRIGTEGGHAASWSADGRYLLATGGVTGSAVGHSQPLALIDLNRRSRSVLLRRRSSGEAFLLPGRRILYGRQDPYARRPGGSGWYSHPHLYVGRLVER